MNNKNDISNLPGNTPVRTVPKDYYPPGGGYWFTLSDGPDRGKKMFFRDNVVGPGSDDANQAGAVVFVHGNPECSYTYRKAIASLADLAQKPCRIIAMDHIGFGLSNQASYEMVSMDHADNLLQLVRRLDLKNVTLVIHDWGGPIGVGAFLREPERVSNIVVLNSTVFPMPQNGITYRNYPVSWLGWSTAPRIIPDKFWGHFAGYAIFRTPASELRILAEMAAYIVKSELGIYPEAEKDARIVYMEQFKSKINARSSKRFVRQSAFWGMGNVYEEPRLGQRDTAPFYDFIQGNIKKSWGQDGRKIGARLLAGRWDPLGKDEVIAQWVENLPQLDGHVQTFEETGHFIEEEKPLEIARAIAEVSGMA